MTTEETINSSWNYWCYYEEYVRNKITGSSFLSRTGKFVPSISGLLRIGVKRADINDTEESITYYTTALKPNVSRMCKDDYPLSAEIRLNARTALPNEGETVIPVTLSNWENPNDDGWITSTPISYGAMDDYSSATYKETVNADLSGLKIEIEGLRTIVHRFFRGWSNGFLLTATNGYCELYGPSSIFSYMRPTLTIVQNVSNKLNTDISLDIEIVSESEVEGVCRYRDGTIITGYQCEITVFDPDTYEIVGTGLSSFANGSFSILTSAKIGNPVIVSFVEETQSISGSKMMETMFPRSISSSSSSSKSFSSSSKSSSSSSSSSSSKSSSSSSLSSRSSSSSSSSRSSSSSSSFKSSSSSSSRSSSSSSSSRSSSSSSSSKSSSSSRSSSSSSSSRSSSSSSSSMCSSSSSRSSSSSSSKSSSSSSRSSSCSSSSSSLSSRSSSSSSSSSSRSSSSSSSSSSRSSSSSSSSSSRSCSSSSSSSSRSSSSSSSSSISSSSKSSSSSSAWTSSSSSRSSSSSSKSSSSSSSSSKSSSSSSSSSSRSSSSSSSRSSSSSSSKLSSSSKSSSSSSFSSSSKSSSSSSSSRSSSSSSSSYSIPANDFLTDPNCYALYNFESGALTVDSKGNNTLVPINTADEDTSNYKQGTCSALFVRANLDHYYVSDVNLDSGFPLKSDDTQKIISVCGWIRKASATDFGYIFAKFNSGQTKRSLAMYSAQTSGKIGLQFGFNSGTSTENSPLHGTSLSNGTWYHVTGSYRNSDQAYAIRVRDTNGDVVGTDLTGTATLDANGLSVSDVYITVGNRYTSDTAEYFFDGNIDELVVFDRFLTADEATAIAQKTYENSSSSSSSRSSSSSSSSSFSESGDVVEFGGDTVEFGGDTVRW